MCDPEHRLLTCPKLWSHWQPMVSDFIWKMLHWTKIFSQSFCFENILAINLATQWHLSLCIRSVVILRRQWTLTSVNLKRVCSFWFDWGCLHRRRSPCYWNVCIVYFLSGKKYVLTDPTVEKTSYKDVCEVCFSSGLPALSFWQPVPPLSYLTDVRWLFPSCCSDFSQGLKWYIFQPI